MVPATDLTQILPNKLQEDIVQHLLLDIAGDLVVVPVEAAELASVVGPVQEVEEKESEREEKSGVKE